MGQSGSKQYSSYSLVSDTDHNFVLERMDENESSEDELFDISSDTQGLTKEWHKHWFVLQGTALMYFRDPTAENNGLLDGIIDLGLVQKVQSL